MSNTPPASSRYVCHQCGKSFERPSQAGALECPHCRSEFVQMMELGTRRARDADGDYAYQDGRRRARHSENAEDVQSVLSSDEEEEEEEEGGRGDNNSDEHEDGRDGDGGDGGVEEGPNLSFDLLQGRIAFLNDDLRHFMHPLTTHLSPFLISSSSSRLNLQPPSQPHSNAQPPEMPTILGLGFADMIRFVVHPQSFPPEHPIWSQVGFRGSIEDYVFSEAAFQRALSSLMDQGGTPVLGLSDAQLDALRRVTFDDLKDPQKEEEQEEGEGKEGKRGEREGEGEGETENVSSATSATCAICQEPYRSGEETILLNCQHQFHEECIIPWLKKVPSCPICRHDPQQPAPSSVEVKK